MLKKHMQTLALATALAVLPGNLVALLAGVLSHSETYALFYIGLTVYLYAAGWAIRVLLAWRAPPQGRGRLWWAARLGALALLAVNADFAAALIWNPARNTENQIVWVLPFLNFILAWILAAHYLILRFRSPKSR